MISKLKELLDECLSESDELKGNILLKRVLNHISLKSELPTIYDILAFTTQLGEGEAMDYQPATPAAEAGIKDCRFLRINIQNARKFGSANIQDFYGVTFADKSMNPLSSVFLGSNGVGKSSVYASLEYVVLHYMYTAAARGYCDEKGQQDYINNAHYPNPCVVLDTVSGSIKYPSGESTMGFPAFFCSEYDIQYLEKNEISLDYIAEQVGLTEAMALIKLLEKGCENNRLVSDNIRLLAEKERLSQNSKKKKNLKGLKELNAVTSKIQDLNFRYWQLWGSMDLAPGLDALHLDDHWNEMATQIIECLKEKIYAILTPFNERLEKFLPELLEAYLVKGEKVQVTFDGHTPIISIVVNTVNSTVSLMSPRQYFNTFRFKLYGVVLKMCLAYCAKTIHRCNFPMVVDDVFDSSDFDNRYKINQFIESIVDKNEKLLEAEHYPLQFIFFTQDDLVGEGVYRGLKSVQGDTMAKFGRIYELEDAEEPDFVSTGIQSEKDRFCNIEDLIR